MSYELHTPSKRKKLENEVRVSYTQKQNNKRICFTLSYDVVEKFFGKRKRVKILKDIKNKCVLLIPTDSDEKSFALCSSSNGLNKHTAFSWDGFFPGEKTGIPAKFLLEEYGNEKGIKVFLPE